MKKITILFLSLFLIVLLNDVKAKSMSSTAVPIKYLNFYSKEESIYPTHKGLTQVVIDGSIPWSSSTGCKITSVIVRNEDKHLVSAILAARASSTPIRLFVDDTLSINQECYLRAVQY